MVLAINYEANRRFAVWLRFCEVYRGMGLKRRPAFVEIQGDIERNLHRIECSNVPNFEFAYPNVDADRKLISDFIAHGAKRKFSNKTIQMFDAFVQIRTPKFLQMLKGKDDLDTMGEIVGHFLKDPGVGDLAYVLEQASQNIMHFFEYDNVDNIGLYDEMLRYVCLFRGRTPDYLFVLDFEYSWGQIASISDQRLRLYYGFCAPGEEFSPLVMRSYCLKERLTGLLYAPASLIGVSNRYLQELKFQVFTTDRAFHGGEKRNGDNSDLVKLAMSAHKGPTLTRRLRKIDESTDLHSKLRGIVNRFKFDFI